MATKISAGEGGEETAPLASVLPPRHTLIWSILSAVGGAALLFVGQVAIEEYRAGREAANKAVAKEEEREQQRSRVLDTVFNEYLALGEQPERAGDFIETGIGGSREDVLAVARHFRKLMSYLVSGQLEGNSVARLYGGKLAFWSSHLGRLGRGESPVSSHFADRHRQNYLLLSDALAHIARQANIASSDPSPIDRVAGDSVPIVLRPGRIEAAPFRPPAQREMAPGEAQPTLPAVKVGPGAVAAPPRPQPGTPDPIETLHRDPHR